MEEMHIIVYMSSDFGAYGPLVKGGSQKSLIFDWGIRSYSLRIRIGFRRI